MKDNDTNRMIDELYQQRKSAISAPKVNLPTSKKGEKKGLLVKYLVALLGGGLASFSILAIITHLANTPVPNAINTTISSSDNNDIEYQKDQLSDLTLQAVEAEIDKIKKQLPNLPNKPEHSSHHSTKVAAEHIINEAIIVNNYSGIKIIEPKLSPALLHKVLPVYSLDNKRILKPTNIKLSYRVDHTGKVYDVKVIQSSTSRSLKKAAVTALSQWQYAANNHDNKKYEVIFEFINPE